MTWVRNDWQPMYIGFAILYSHVTIEIFSSGGGGLTSGSSVPFSRGILSLSRVFSVRLMKAYVLCYLYLANSKSSKY